MRKKNIPNHTLEMEVCQQLGARYQARVMKPTRWDECGNVLESEPVTDWTDPKGNLVLPAGFWAYGTNVNWFGMMAACVAGTGTTPNKVILDGTFQQSGTTVTRASGTGVFSSANVNDFVKFGSGEKAKVTSFTNTLTVEVDRSQTVAASSLTVYDCSRVTLDAWVRMTTATDIVAGANGASNDTVNGVVRYWKTFNFDVESSPVTYTELGMTQSTTNNGSQTLFSRVLLDAPVAVAAGQFLQIRVDFACALTNYRTSAAITANITGWPRPYTISSITPGTAGGTAFDILLTENCSSHYATGRPIVITGALPVKTAITSISSTAIDFTVTTAAPHGLTSGDSVVIAGASPSAYNGTWTAAAGTTGSTVVVTSVINPGAGSGGTVRLATPATWYDGTWTIASFPSANTIRVTNNTITVAAGVDGTVKNNLNANAIVCGTAAFYYNASMNTLAHGVVDMSNNTTIGGKNFIIFDEANMKTGMQYGVTPSTSGSLGSMSATAGSYDTANRKRAFSATFVTGAIISQTIRQVVLQANSSYFFITFDERQRKDNLYQLSFSVTVSWEPDLT